MSLANHLEELQRKHGDIEREIDEAMLHPSVDDLEIVKLKRRKLALKDEIEKLKVPTYHALNGADIAGTPARKPLAAAPKVPPGAWVIF